MTTSEPTTYVILLAPEGESSFEVLPEPVTARSSDDAVRKIAEQGEKAGTFVAVPARSWRPRKVRLETRPILRVESPEESVEEEAADDDDA